MASTNLNKVFGSVHSGKPAPFLSKLERQEQYNALALYVYTRRSELCYDDGWYKGSLRQLVRTWFELDDTQLKNFMAGLKSSDVFETNGYTTAACRYRVTTNGEFDELLKLYQAYVGDTTGNEPEPEGATGTSKQHGSELDHGKWDQAERNGEHETEAFKGMPPAFRDSLAAKHLAQQLFDGDLCRDPDMAELVGVELGHLARKAKQANQ